jgi:hypothetical protein
MSSIGTPPPIARVAISCAATSYLANAALGVSVATGVIHTGKAHWVHHALYVTTATLTVAAVVGSALAGRTSAGGRASSAALLLSPALLPLAAIPFVGTHTVSHPVTASAAAPFYLAALIRIWRK